MKSCSTCRSQKDFAEFSKRASSKDGRKPVCKLCDAAYMLARRQADPEGERARSRRTREKDPESWRAGKRKAYHADPEKARAQRRASHARRAATRPKRRKPDDGLSARQRAQKVYYAKKRETILDKSAAYRAENPDKRHETQKRWRLANPDKVNAYGARRRAARLQRVHTACPELLALVEAEVFETARLMTHARSEAHEVDHTVPLQSPIVCGLHNEHNMAVLARGSNRSKSNRFWPGMP